MPIEPASPDALATAARLLREGRLVAFPTETVYGLGADATNGRAVAAIFEAKGRPRFNPLIVHVTDLAAAEALGVFGATARRLAAAFWPGPLTLVVPRAPGCPVSDLATAGLDTLAIRVPSHPVAQALLAAAGVPVVAPSANRSGHVSATTAQHVFIDLGGRVDLVLDAGPTQHGIESTVIDATGDVPVLLRPGAITTEAIAGTLGFEIGATAPTDDARPSSPGQLSRHYATNAVLRLDAREAGSGEPVLAFGPAPIAHDGPMINLSPSGELREAAANLFAALRNLDRECAVSHGRSIAVMPIPSIGLGAAINDRLRRAATPHPDYDNGDPRG